MSESKEFAAKLVYLATEIIWKEINRVHGEELERVRALKLLTLNEHDKKILEKIETGLEDFLANGKERVMSLLKSGMSGAAAAELIAERIRNGEKI